MSMEVSNGKSESFVNGYRNSLTPRTSVNSVTKTKKSISGYFGWNKKKIYPLLGDLSVVELANKNCDFNLATEQGE